MMPKDMLAENVHKRGFAEASRRFMEEAFPVLQPVDPFLQVALVHAGHRPVEKPKTMKDLVDEFCQEHGFRVTYFASADIWGFQKNV